MSIGSIIGSVVGAGLSLFGHSGSHGGDKATQTTQMRPAAWESDAKRFWDQFVDLWFGGKAGGGGTAASEEYQRKIDELQRKLDELYKELDYAMSYPIEVEGQAVDGTRPVSEIQADINRVKAELAQIQETSQGKGADAGRSTLEEMLKQDWEARKGVGAQYLGTEQRITTEALKNLANLEQQYRSQMSPIRIGLGNFATNYVPRSQQRVAQGTLHDMLKTLATSLALKGAQAAREKQYGETYTPNAAEIEYITNYLEPLAMKLNLARYRIPTQTQTGSLSGPSTLSQIGTAAQTGLSVYNFLSKLFD